MLQVDAMPTQRRHQTRCTTVKPVNRSGLQGKGSRFPSREGADRSIVPIPLGSYLRIASEAGTTDFRQKQSQAICPVDFLGAANLENLPVQLRVEAVEGVISIRVQGRISADTVRQRHDLMLRSVDSTGFNSILFDVRHAQSPTEEARRLQQYLNAELSARGLRLAVVVADSPMAFLSRQTFFGLHHRVFYDDVETAARWLQESGDSD